MRVRPTEGGECHQGLWPGGGELASLARPGPGGTDTVLSTESL